jgi:hypothetical protein
MSAQYGYRFNTDGFTPLHTDAYRAARFDVRDLRGARFVDCDFSGVRAVSGTFVDVELSGWVDGLSVNGVDVTEYVTAELDRRHPERAQLRAVASIEDFRALWATVEGLWKGADTRVAMLPGGAADESVAGEWSYAQTLRHLIWVTDAWAGRTVLDEEKPYHPLGLPQHWFPTDDALALGLDPESRLLDDLSNQDLGRPVTRTPGPHYPDEPRVVYQCLAVVMEEEIDHYRYAVRDLAILETRAAEPAISGTPD